MMIAAAEIDFAGSILQFGATGAVLLWFMLRMEPRMRAMEKVIEQNTKSIMLLVVALGERNGNCAIVDQANGIIREIEESEKRSQK